MGVWLCGGRVKRRSHVPELTAERRQVIEDRANRFLVEQGVVGVPVDIKSLVKKLDFRVKELDFRDNRTTGMIAVNENEWIENTDTHRLIAVGKQLGHERSRFIIAHELGHYLLHKTQEQPLFARRDTDTNRSDEPEAELFGRAILMPKDKMEEAVRYFKSNERAQKAFSSISKFIGALFDVTEKKALVRLEELCLLG